ncbi:MAG: porin family protein [Bacteroidota bacterium]
MKKKLTTLSIALLVFTTPLMSQKQVYFGLAGAGLISVITNQNNYTLDFKLAYKVAVGGSVNANMGFDFNNNLGLKLEIGFAKLGQRYQDTHMDTMYTRNIKLNYLQIPLMFKYRTMGEVAKFYVMAGPQFDILLSARQKYLKQDEFFDDPVPGTWSKPTVIGQETITDRYHSLDILGRMDLGVDITVASNLFLNVGLTMAYGFIDINAPDWQISNDNENYNPSHNIYGGINFGINYMLPLVAKK